MTYDFPALLNDHEAGQVIAAIESQGSNVRFIGGCVRDALLGLQIGEIDLATTAPPEQVMAILTAKKINVVPTGIKHGTVTAILNRRSFEITTLRHDIETDGRHAQVAFHDDWEQDARRRDFTVNALSVDSTGTLYDYCHGIDDIKQKKLRFIDDPEKRIREDYLRLLRYFRFASTLDWELEQKTVEICAALSKHLTGLSRERIQSELYKLLCGKGMMRVIQVMIDRNILAAFIAKPDPDRLKQIKSNDPFLRLIALAGTELETFIVLSRDQKSRLKTLDQIDPSWPLHKLLYFYGSQAVNDYAELHGKDWKTEDWEKPVFPLKAAHLTPLAGKELGDILKKTESWWVDQHFQPDLNALLVRALELKSQE